MQNMKKKEKIQQKKFRIGIIFPGRQQPSSAHTKDGRGQIKTANNNRKLT
jgi:hypothetical protein